MEQEAAIEQETVQKPQVEHDRPRVFFESITFQDDTEITLGEADIVVLVGGNSSGKSRVLKDLEAILAGEAPIIIKQVKSEKIGTANEVQFFLEHNSQKKEDKGYIEYQYLGNHFNRHSETDMGYYWRAGKNSIERLAPFFCRRIKTEARITDSNPAPVFDTLKAAPSNPIQFLSANTPAEKKLSSYFKSAFNQDLIIDKGTGNIPLLVGKYQEPLNGEDRTDSEFRKRLHKEATALEEQGDGMRSFASVILQTLADSVPSILLLDEPEAFLHSPQAKILGRLLAKERPRDAQLFIATHSADILMGLLETAPENLHIIRLDREGENYAVELDKNNAKAIIDDPFLRYSKILSGIFYKRVILCEAEMDCLFYQAVLDALSTENVSDALFLPVNGKDNFPKMAEILKALHIPVDIIADIDILQNAGGSKLLKKIIDTLNGDWASTEKQWKPLLEAIEQERPAKSTNIVREELSEKLSALKEKQDFDLKDIKTVWESILQSASPWKMLKRAGKNALPKGDVRENWKILQRLCAEIGLWIVPAGEVESFADTGGHGPQWVQEVLETKNLREDAELENARKFITAVWDKKPEALN